MKRHKFIVVLLIFIVAAGLLVYQLLPKGQDKVSATISIESKGLDITSAHMVMQSTMYSEDGTSNPKMSEEVWLEMPGKMHSRRCLKRENRCLMRSPRLMVVTC